jgi:hypothetical protein
MRVLSNDGGAEEEVGHRTRSVGQLNEQRKVTGPSDVEVRRTNRYRANGTLGISGVVLLLVFLTSNGANAQNITFGGAPGGDPVTALCSVSGTVTISDGDDCDNTQNFATHLTIGTPTSHASFNASDGSANFTGSASFNGSFLVTSHAVFQGSQAATFAGNATFNGGFVVENGETVNMGDNRVQNVAAPVVGTDATNKDYVDGLHNQQQTQINDIVVVNNQQNTRLNNVENVNMQQDTRLTNIETVNTQQDARLAQHDTRLTSLESGFAGQAEQIASINKSIKSLSRRDGELADGIAISLALAQPAFQPGQKFAIRGGWGNFDGSNAFGVSGAGLVHSFRNGGSVILDVGVGMSARYNMFAGRGGVTLGW